MGEPGGTGIHSNTGIQCFSSWRRSAKRSANPSTQQSPCWMKIRSNGNQKWLQLFNIHKFDVQTSHQKWCKTSMHTTKTKSRCWLLSFAEAPGSGDRWQMDRLENPKLGGGFKHCWFPTFPGEWSNLTNIFQMGWNHRLEKGLWWLWGGQVLKRFQYISGEKISSWRVYTTRKTSWSWSDRFSFLGNFSRGICCPTAEYEINIWTFVVYNIFHHVLYIFGVEKCYHTP